MVIRHHVQRMTTNGTTRPQTLTVNDPFHGELTFSHELVTPAMADRWLKKHNLRNRRINPRHVQMLTRQMTEGYWMLVTDAIGFDCNDEIVNGQHRLTAVKESGNAQHFIIIRGLNPETFDYIDLARKRQPDDLFTRLGGFINTTQLGATLRLMLIYRQTGQFRDPGNQLANAEIVHQLEREPGIEHAVHRAMQLRSEGLKFVPPSLVAALYQIFTECAPNEVDNFMEKLATGLGLSDKSDPIHAVRRRLEDSKGLTKNEKAELVIKAWNYHRRGEPVTKLVVRNSIPKPL